MANANRVRIMRENAAKDERLTILGIEHSVLLDDSASNRDHLVQRKEYNRLLGIISTENDPLEDPPLPSELSPADPLDDPTDPVNDEPPNDLDDDDHWLLEGEPLIQIHQPAAASKQPEPSAPPASSPDKPVPDIGQQINSELQDAKKTVAGSNQLLRELQQQLVELGDQDRELASLRDKIKAYENAERTLAHEIQQQKKELAKLRLQLSIHQPVYEADQLVCLNKKEHDELFVERGKTVHRMWKWGCIGPAVALFFTAVFLIVLWTTRPDSDNTAVSPVAKQTDTQPSNDLQQWLQQQTK